MTEEVFPLNVKYLWISPKWAPLKTNKCGKQEILKWM